MDRRRVTDRTLKTLKPGDAVRDTEVVGFIARRHGDGRVSFEVRRQGRHPIHRVLGRDDVLTAGRAKDEARKLLAKHVVAHSSEPGKRYTLETAWPLYKADLLRKGAKRSPKTIIAYQKGLDRLAPSVRKTSLRSLGEDPSIFTVEHDRIAKEHRPAADASGRIVRILYRYIRKRFDHALPPQEPTVDLDVSPKPAVNPRVLREDGMAAWWRLVKTMPDVVRREANLFLLLSGLRPESLLAMRWSDQNPDDARLFEIPRPKGGTAKAFTLICSEPMRACLNRVLAHRYRTGLVFASDRGRGAITELHESAAVTSYGPRALRRGYGTMAGSVGVPETDIKRFLNHRTATPILALYVRTDPAGALLVEYQKRISARIVEALGDPSLSLPEKGSPHDEQYRAMVKGPAA